MRATLSSFLGPSCADEQMDHDELLLAPYTTAQANAQIDNLPAEYGAQGKLALSMIRNYVQGINAYIARAETHPALMPVEYSVFGSPKPWTPADVVAISALIGGFFGDGGGGEVGNAALLKYLQGQLGQSADRPRSPTSRSRTTRRRPRRSWTSRSATRSRGTSTRPRRHPGQPGRPAQGRPDRHQARLHLRPPAGRAAHKAGLPVIESLLRVPAQMSNALVVGASHSASGHPIAVFGPQVSYFAPGILMQEDLHSPSYDAEGASFPGTGFVELGRGEDYAWSATSAGTDLTDQRLELICNPNGGPVSPTGTFYMFDGKCIPMVNERFTDGTGLVHQIHLTVHGVVQGWTTARQGKPVAVVNQRSTYGHDVDSVIGFLRLGEPALTHDATVLDGRRQQGRLHVQLVLRRQQEHRLLRQRPGPGPAPFVDPNLPTWGTGGSEWRGFLPSSRHVHEINPPQGFFDSWNNKPAPLFSASDNQYGYGPVYRVQMLTDADPAPVRPAPREDHPGEPGAGDGDRGHPGPGRHHHPAGAARRAARAARAAGVGPDAGGAAGLVRHRRAPDAVVGERHAVRAGRRRGHHGPAHARRSSRPSSTRCSPRAAPARTVTTSSRWASSTSRTTAAPTSAAPTTAAGRATRSRPWTS